MKAILTIFTASLFQIVISQEFGALFLRKVGEPIPKPQCVEKFDGYMVIRPQSFLFQTVEETCPILQEAFFRYHKILTGLLYHSDSSNVQEHKHCHCHGHLDMLYVNLSKPCEDYPYLGMDESYTLHVNSPRVIRSATIESKSVWGILRGLETFSQLAMPDTKDDKLRLNSCKIVDFPRFAHRGFMLDTSRHYFPVACIRLLLDSLAMNKYNVFHWHIVDDQSFPYESKLQPRLSSCGAYKPDMIYTQRDIRQLITYAKMRGIRIIPEFDNPGHTLSWGGAYPTLLTRCYNNGNPSKCFGPLNLAKEEVFRVLDSLLCEVHTVFGDKYIHLGGDEINTECWLSNPEVLEFLRKINIQQDAKTLVAYYYYRLFNITHSRRIRGLVWQDVFDFCPELDKCTIVHIWKDNYKDKLPRITRAGYNVILSSFWYLNEGGDAPDWTEYYRIDPQDFQGNEKQKKLVLGGEALMWSEFTDSTNIHQKIWPRAAVIAERLWSSCNVNNQCDLAQRLEEFISRLRKRGIPAPPPNGPGFNK